MNLCYGYTECKFAKCRYDDCRYTECRYDECHGVNCMNAVSCKLRPKKSLSD
jgi:hypothetical protein